MSDLDVDGHLRELTVPEPGDIPALSIMTVHELCSDPRRLADGLGAELDRSLEAARAATAAADAGPVAHPAKPRPSRSVGRRARGAKR